MKITDEQLDAARCAYEAERRRRIDMGVDVVGSGLSAARRALEFWAPILLAPMTEEEAKEFKNFGSLTAIQRCIADRLRSVLAKPDPAIEAGMKVCSHYGISTSLDADEAFVVRPEFITEFISAVDAARKGGAR